MPNPPPTMKSATLLICLLLLGVQARAEFRVWKNADGKSAELKLLEVVEQDGQKVGKFKLRNGRQVELKMSELSGPDATALADWKPPVDEFVPSSVFDQSLDGNLVKLDGKKLKPFKDFKKPSKYYLFYYTASWCPPCRAFTPTLVDWYHKNKNDSFELVLITSDRDEGAMEGYAKDKKMPWPQLELKKVRNFRGDHLHGVRGIPSLIVCELDGKMLGNYRSRLPELTSMVKD